MMLAWRTSSGATHQAFVHNTERPDGRGLWVGDRGGRGFKLAAGGELSPGIKEAPRGHPEDLNQIDLEAADKVGRSMAYGQR
jgi:hypothetical protein